MQTTGSPNHGFRNTRDLGPKCNLKFPCISSDRDRVVLGVSELGSQESKGSPAFASFSPSFFSPLPTAPFFPETLPFQGPQNSSVSTGVRRGIWRGGQNTRQRRIFLKERHAKIGKRTTFVPISPFSSNMFRSASLFFGDNLGVKFGGPFFDRIIFGGVRWKGSVRIFLGLRGNCKN